MQTDFFAKKRWIYFLICQFFMLFVTTVFIYAVFLSGAKSVWIGKNFYFLVSENEHVEAGALDVKLDGGAGYLFHYKGKEYVVWSVYFNGEDGKTVQASTSANGKATSLLEVGVERLYFKSCKEKKNASLYQDALACLYNCMEVLGLEIERLDNGATQRSSVETLKILLTQLRYLSKRYEGNFCAYADVCIQAGEYLETLIEDIVYTKDLRYLLCDLSSKYIKLSSFFSL